MNRAVALLLLAGCGRLGFAVGDGETGPSGDDADPMGDGGGDTASVICPFPHDHDEDGDGVDDQCDVCPHRANPGQEDADGDDVGDACDPNPNTPGEGFVHFDPFVFQKPDLMTSGAEIWDGEQIIVDATNGMWAGWYTATIGPNDVVTIGGTQGARGAASTRILSLLMSNDPARYFCQQWEQGGVPEIAYTESLDGVDYTHVDATILTTAPMGRFEMTLAHTNGSTITCTFDGEGALDGVAAGAKPAIQPTDVSINVIGKSVTLSYLVHISVP